MKILEERAAIHEGLLPLAGQLGFIFMQADLETQSVRQTEFIPAVLTVEENVPIILVAGVLLTLESAVILFMLVSL